MDFDWDQHNRDKNRLKHHVGSEEAEEIFNHGLFLGPIPGDNEDRFAVMGTTRDGRILFVVYTLRDGKIRVISARDASRKERRAYAEKIKTASPL